MVTVYFAGGEDQDHFAAGGAAVQFSGFRATYVRCSLNCPTSGGTQYWQNYNAYVGSPTSIWFSVRIVGPSSNSSNAVGQSILQITDNSGVSRLQLRVSANFTSPWPVAVEKVNTAGAATGLTNTLTGTTSFNVQFAGTSVDKFDINWVNAVSGSIDIYFNGVQVYHFSGDTTTEVTTLGFHRLRSTNAGAMAWSEIIVCDTDTRSMSLQTLAPVANGNTHNFDTGSPAAANVNETTLNDATLDGSTTPGQIDQYTIPGIAAGTYAIIAVGVSARIQKGVTGPSKMDLGVRSTSDYWSSDQVLTPTWANYQNWWVQDPNTSASWLALPSNIGLKSVT